MILPLKFDDSFKGTIQINVPKYQERMVIIKNLNMKANDKGEVGITDETIESTSKLRDLAGKHIHSIDLEHVDSGMKFNNLDDLEYYQEFNDVLNRVVDVVINGLKLGNASKSPSDSKQDGPIEVAS